MVHQGVVTTLHCYVQARVQSLLRIVAEQNDLHPSLTSLTSFTSHLDVEDEVYQNYTKREESLAGNENKRLILKRKRLSSYFISEEWM